MQKIAHGNNNIILNNGVNIRLNQEIENRLYFPLTIRRTKTHKFTITKNSNNFNLISILELFNNVLDYLDPFFYEWVLKDLLGKNLNCLDLSLELRLDTTHYFVQLLLHLLLFRTLGQLYCFDFVLDRV